ncbi:hypothetical protein L210DRAFT_855625, partial [Boletus edulis BED1]
ANHLSTCNEQLRATDTLDEAVFLGRDALALLPPTGFSESSISVKNLVISLSTQFTRVGQLKDKEDIFNLYAELTRVLRWSSPDLSAPRGWIRFTIL